MSVEDKSEKQSMSRRGFLRGSAVAAGGLAVGGVSQAFLTHSAHAGPGTRDIGRTRRNRQVGYGELSKRRPDNRDLQFGTAPLQALPVGFRYSVLGR